jgi:hypothetical protein
MEGGAARGRVGIAYGGLGLLARSHRGGGGGSDARGEGGSSVVAFPFLVLGKGMEPLPTGSWQSPLPTGHWGLGLGATPPSPAYAHAYACAYATYNLRPRKAAGMVPIGPGGQWGSAVRF